MAASNEEDGDTIRFRLDSRVDKPGLIGICLFFGLIPFSSFLTSDTRSHPWVWFLFFGLTCWSFSLFMVRMMLPGIGAVLEIDKVSMRLIRSGEQVWRLSLKDVAWRRNLEEHSLRSGIDLLNKDGNSIAVIPTKTVPPRLQVQLRTTISNALKPFLSPEPAPPIVDSTPRSTYLISAIVGNVAGVSMILFALSLISNSSYHGETTPGIVLLFSFPALGIGLYGVFGWIRKRKSSSTTL